nr:zinc finger, CCHC-type [Tanacetum cinerariifolium]
MATDAMKHIALNFAKLDKFERVDFRKWQKKMHFLLSSMCVVYVLTTPIPDDGENATVEQLRKRDKWDNDDYVCGGLILNDMSDPLFVIYQNSKSSKELWDSLEAKYMVEDASSIAIYGGPVETRVENFLGGIVRAMMSSGGTMVASFKNIQTFLPVHTPLDNLININPKEIGSS